MAVLTAACGSVDHGAPDAHGSPDAPGAIDAAPPRCSPTAAFGTPVAVAALNTTSSDESAWLTPDELTVYFDSIRPGGAGGYDIYVATRSTPTDDFGTPSLLAGVNTAGHERGPELTDDGLALYSTIDASPDYNIGLATRASTASSFGALAAIDAIDSTSIDTTSGLLPDGSAIYVASNRNAGNYDLYRAAKNGSSFDAPQPLTGTNLNTSAVESSAAVTPDELKLYFASDRASPGTNVYDVYEATRTSVTVGFGEPVSLGLDPTGTHNTAPTWISADNCVLYITSTSTSGDYDIYVATRGN